jgi:hypothetical protein
MRSLLIIVLGITCFLHSGNARYIVELVPADHQRLLQVHFVGIVLSSVQAKDAATLKSETGCNQMELSFDRIAMQNHVKTATGNASIEMCHEPSERTLEYAAMLLPIAWNK